LTELALTLVLLLLTELALTLVLLLFLEEEELDEELLLSFSFIFGIMNILGCLHFESGFRSTGGASGGISAILLWTLSELLLLELLLLLLLFLELLLLLLDDLLAAGTSYLTLSVNMSSL